MGNEVKRWELIGRSRGSICFNDELNESCEYELFKIKNGDFLCVKKYYIAEEMDGLDIIEETLITPSVMKVIHFFGHDAAARKLYEICNISTEVKIPYEFL